jgi:hypothetical protein
MFFRGLDLGISHTLYAPIFVGLIVLWAAYGRREHQEMVMERPESGRRWAVIGVCLAIVLVGITFVSINMHKEPLGGSHKRFFTEEAQEE